MKRKTAPHFLLLAGVFFLISPSSVFNIFYSKGAGKWGGNA
jgi:hypothetical protein